VADSITARDVARLADVSAGTVSRVFNNYNNVSEEIRQRVLKAAADLGYPGPYRQSTNHQNTTRILKEVGFLYSSSIEETPATLDPYWAPIFHGVETESRHSNIKIIYRTVTDIRHNLQQLTRTLYEMRLGGALLVGQFEADAINAIQATGTPVVLVDNYVEEMAQMVDVVLADNFQGARLAMDHLFEQGHRHIAFIAGPATPGIRPFYKIYATYQRWASYCMSFLDRGLTVDPILVEPGNLTLEGGYQACQRLLAQRADFSAIFCADDITAIGAMKALREAGRSIPEEVSIIGFDDIDTGRHVTPALSTIRVNAEDLGATALRTLISRVANPSLPCVTIQLNAELVQRASVTSPHRS
jgi:DNA-binding LacI/PurR family transcriptional regulator